MTDEARDPTVNPILFGTEKDDTAEAIYERGSFHLKTCPAKP